MQGKKLLLERKWKEGGLESFEDKLKESVSRSETEDILLDKNTSVNINGSTPIKIQAKAQNEFESTERDAIIPPIINTQDEDLNLHKDHNAHESNTLDDKKKHIAEENIVKQSENNNKFVKIDSSKINTKLLNKLKLSDKITEQLYIKATESRKAGKISLIKTIRTVFQ